VAKVADQVYPADTIVFDRLNIVYASTTITKGRARGIVFATGEDTEMGSISKQLNAAGTLQRPKLLSRKNSMATSSMTGDVEPLQNGTGSSTSQHVCYWVEWAWYPLGKFLGTNVGTPLQRKLGWLWIYLFLAAVVCLIIVFGANYWLNAREVIIYAIATAISNLPAALPVVLTLTRTKGISIMSKLHVIVRKASALESLGSVTNICSDKTGTITQGKMMLSRAWVPSSVEGMSGTWVIDMEDPFDPEIGSLRFVSLPPSEMTKSLEDEDSSVTQTLTPSPDTNAQLRTFLNTASLCNLAHVHKHLEVSEIGLSEERWVARGDPTEIAIQVFVSRFDWNRARLMDKGVSEAPQCGTWTFIDEFPFDSDVKRMSVMYSTEINGVSEKHVFVKGAVERILDRCTTWYPESSNSAKQSRRMTDEDRAYIMTQMESLSCLGLRTLALASRVLAEHETREAGGSEDGKESKTKLKMTADRDAVECNLTFYGLVGIYDPPRQESVVAVRACHEAGIGVHMVS
jgi:Na+-exporting ATPase